MKRFHSSGTASGNVEVMWMWKMTMPTTAIVPERPAPGHEQQQRQRELHGRAEVRGERRPSRGPQVLRDSCGTAGAWPRASGSTACC